MSKETIISTLKEYIKTKTDYNYTPNKATVAEQLIKFVENMLNEEASTEELMIFKNTITSSIRVYMGDIYPNDETGCKQWLTKCPAAYSYMKFTYAVDITDTLDFNAVVIKAIERYIESLIYDILIKFS